MKIHRIKILNKIYHKFTQFLSTLLCVEEEWVGKIEKDEEGGGRRKIHLEECSIVVFRCLIHTFSILRALLSCVFEYVVKTIILYKRLLP